MSQKKVGHSDRPGIGITENTLYRWVSEYKQDPVSVYLTGSSSQRLVDCLFIGKFFICSPRLYVNVFEQIFMRILEEAMRHGFVDPDVLFVDTTHVKTDTNKNKYIKQLIREQVRSYQKQLEDEINEDRIAHGKQPLGKKPEDAVKEVKMSTTDPESGLFVKGEKERVYACSWHTACDRNGLVLGTVVTAGNAG